MSVAVRPTRRRRRHAALAAAACVLSAAVLVASHAASADAHPFGPPPTARVWAEGTRVVIDWGAAPDDAIVIGVELGILEPETVEAYMDGPTRVAPEREKEERLSRSQDLRDYILERIRVWQDGRRCAAEVRPIDNFVTHGATTTHDCPDPVTAVAVEITMLHEVHDAYRTFAFSAGDAQPAQAVFTVASPRHDWVFSGDAGRDGSSGIGWETLALIALAVVVIGGIVTAEVLSSRQSEPTDGEA